MGSELILACCTVI